MDRLSKLKVDIRNLKEQNKDKQLTEYLLSFDNFTTFEVFKDIFRVLFEEDKIRIHYAETIISKIKLVQNKFERDQIRLFLHDYLKNVNPELDCYNFFYLINQEHKEGNTTFIISKEISLDISHFRLENYTKNHSDIRTAFSLFYVCWEKVDENNKVHITKRALELMREFVNKVPKDYLNFLLRPKYFPPMTTFYPGQIEFVFEPFTEQIFGGWPNFENFLKEQAVNKVDIKELTELYKKYEENQFISIQIPKNQLADFNIDLSKWNE